MELLTDQVRLALLVFLCGLLWSLESLVSLYQYRNSRVRHDQKEADSNYSNIFSSWDRLFGTYTSVTDFGKLSYGLDGFDVKERQTSGGLLRMPFMNYNRF